MVAPDGGVGLVYAGGVEDAAAAWAGDDAERGDGTRVPSRVASLQDRVAHKDCSHVYLKSASNSSSIDLQ